MTVGGKIGLKNVRDVEVPVKEKETKRINLGSRRYRIWKSGAMMLRF